MSDNQQIVLSVDVLASTAAAQGDAERAARLFAAGRFILEGVGLSRSSVDPFIYESHIEAVRGALGEDAFRREWAAGQAMSWEQTRTYALSGSPLPGRES
jgi:non-specific serine/threonine protein kinase